MPAERADLTGGLVADGAASPGVAFGSASMAGSGGLQASATVAAPSSATLAGAGTLGALATVTPALSASAAGELVGTIYAEAAGSKITRSVLKAKGIIGALGRVAGKLQATLPGAGSLAALGTVVEAEQSGDLEIPIVGGLLVDGDIGPERLGFASLPAAGGLTPNGTVIAVGQAQLDGAGLLAALGVQFVTYTETFDTTVADTVATLVRRLGKVMPPSTAAAVPTMPPRRVVKVPVAVVAAGVGSKPRKRTVLAAVQFAKAAGVGTILSVGERERVFEADGAGVPSWARRTSKTYPVVAAGLPALLRRELGLTFRSVGAAVVVVPPLRVSKLVSVAGVGVGTFSRSTDLERRLTVDAVGVAGLVRNLQLRRELQATALGAIGRSGWRVCAPAGALTGGDVVAGGGARLFVMDD